MNSIQRFSNIMVRVAWRVAVALVLLACSTQVRADYIQDINVGAASIVDVSYPPVGSGRIYAGQNVISEDATTTFHPGDTYYTFCVDLLNPATPGGEYAVNVRATSDGLTNGTQIAYLYNNYGDFNINPSGSYSINSVPLTGNDYAGAVQLAIWDELVNGGTTSGPLVYSVEGSDAALINAAVSFLLSDAAANSAGAAANWGDSNGSAALLDTPPLVQGQGFLLPATVPITTPEPGTLTLVALALGCLVMQAGRRRFRSAG